MSTEQRIGTVVAVCMSREHGFPTYPQTMVSVGLLGIPGDAHSGKLRESFTNPGKTKPNDRPISIVSEEIRLEVNSDLGLDMQHGDFNEQIVVQGLGDLGDVPIGTMISFNSGLILEVVDRAMPCKKLEDHNGKGLIKALAFKQKNGIIYSRRGILCRVLQAGDLEPGNSLTINIYE